MADVADLHDAARELLQASIDSLDTIPVADPTLAGAPDRAFVAAGQPVLDCCDQLTVTVAQILDAPTAPGGLASGRKIAAKITHVYFSVLIARCAPPPDKSGNPPPAAAMEESARQTNADAWALWNHLYNLWTAGMLFTFCDEVFWDALRPTGHSGGCVGWVLAIHISLDGYQEAIST